MPPMFSVVYASEWEDIMYFTDEDKARRRLVIQSIRDEEFNSSFIPILYEYNDHEGVFYRCKTAWYIDPNILRQLGHTNEDIFRTPSLAYPALAILA